MTERGRQTGRQTKKEAGRMLRVPDSGSLRVSSPHVYVHNDQPQIITVHLLHSPQTYRAGKKNTERGERRATAEGLVSESVIRQCPGQVFVSQTEAGCCLTRGAHRRRTGRV
jgi:hypothetical protein